MESDKEQRAEFEAWERTQPRCIGYPKCDGGDLVGVEHEKDCPLYGVARSTGRRWMFGHLDVWQAAQSPLLERIRSLEKQLAESLKVWDGQILVIDTLRGRVAELEQGMREKQEESEAWKDSFNMYRTAWLREMGGTIVRKSHEIDGFVLRARYLYECAQKWIAHENGVLNRDPFWMVNEAAPIPPSTEPK